MLWLLPLLFTSAYAASFAAYYDSSCTVPITTAVAFTDVCTWSSNQYSGSWSLFLLNCTSSDMIAVVYNASDFPTCQGVPNYGIPITSECTQFQDSYIKGLDFTCESQNNVYNIVAHFESDCQDGGVPFSIQLGEGTCQGDSFAPGFLHWDTQGGYSNPYYTMTVYNTTNGSCQDKRAVFETKSFPAQCLPPTKPFYNLSVDIFEAFPIIRNE